MPTRWVGQGRTLECCYKLRSLDMRETLLSLSTRISSFPKVFFFPSQFFSPRCVFCRAGLASSPVCTHCLALFSWHLGEASRQYHNTVINSNYCFLQTFSTFNLEGGCCIRALRISVSRYSSKVLCNASCLVTCLAQNVYLTSHLWVGRFLVSVIACGLCCLLFCGFSPSVCVHKGGISGPDNGNNPTGNWAALSKLYFSHLLRTKILVPCCSSHNDLS